MFASIHSIHSIQVILMIHGTSVQSPRIYDTHCVRYVNEAAGCLILQLIEFEVLVHAGMGQEGDRRRLALATRILMRSRGSAEIEIMDIFWIRSPLSC